MRQIIERGRGSANKLNKLIRTQNKNILIVCGRSLYENVHAIKAIKKIEDNHNLIFFSDFDKDPKIEDAIKGGKIFKKNKCEIIIAIGGGSAIDIAKLINAYDNSPNSFYDLAKGAIKINSPCKQLIAIPTTAGTGSESTHFAVVYIRNKKYSLASKFILPSIAIVDSDLVMTMPRYVAACSAFDALSQSIESYWSISSNKTSRNYSIRAMKLIINNIEKGVILRDKRSVSNLMIAANLAGQAINITKTTAPHALSYKLSSLTNIAHGHAVAITLGKFFTINHFSKNINKSISMRKHCNTMNSIYKIFRVNGPAEAEIKWYKLMKKCYLEIDYNKLNLYHSKISNKIINSVNLERLNNHPVNLSQRDFKSIFEK